jgi:hypothetical protein
MAYEEVLQKTFTDDFRRVIGPVIRGSVCPIERIHNFGHGI